MPNDAEIYRSLPKMPTEKNFFSHKGVWLEYYKCDKHYSGNYRRDNPL